MDATAWTTSPGAAHIAEVRAIHRVAAGAVGVLIGVVAVLWLSGHRGRRGVTAVVLMLLFVTAFLALLGRYTPGAASPAVTLGNLLGGMALLALLWLLREQLTVRALPPVSRLVVVTAHATLLLVAAQVVVGGLVSAKYAALACVTLPDCNGLWWPQYWSWAVFDPLHQIQASGSDLAPAMRRTLHIVHRYGAVLTACAVAGLAAALCRSDARWRALGVIVAGILLLQIALGAALILAPPLLMLTVAHDTAAALLLAAAVTLTYRTNAAKAR